MIKYFLCSIIVLTFVTLYLGYKKNNHRLFQCIISLLVAGILFNVTALFVSEQILLERDYILYLPFAFLYGPLLCFAFQSLSDTPFKPWKILLHLSPFGFAVLIYILRYTDVGLFENQWLRYSYHTVRTLFLLVYALSILFFYRFNHNVAYRSAQKLIQWLGFLMLICSIIYIIFAYKTIFYGETADKVIPGRLIYAILFAGVFLVFRYTINGFISPEGSKLETDSGNKEEEVKRYQKSTLSEALLDSYEQQLYALMIRQKVFLDAELSLASLAKELRIPKHHLTQVLSVRVGENFYHYVNRFRIDYACKLINKSVVDLTLEELAYKSGFNSKTSFNRYFKSQVGCTPSEYRNL
ncbi:AraC-type DNA-binding protein [Pedobacter steynii]|uniref:AraC-type DNA-binding protein n=1 Tax=Pedobacter steynii TaxID=430522 RepID=A0A1G9WLU0_9SPHI|nr:helix-turn-helix domain-containing protein [Pedobacter steynii]NQX40337.1 AraC family transcriptional regulator [Pedobacter steynii]SDM85572.1 AraC-type DNA-binding protein [Pedobacter steynii]